MKLDTIQTAINDALKTHSMEEVETLRDIVAAVKKAAIDKRCEITDELVDEILLKEQKIVQEMIDTCPEIRTDLLVKYDHKMRIINSFAPKIITDKAKITAMIDAALAQEFGEAIPTNKGLIMKTLMPQLKGKVDMKIANQVISIYTK